MPILTTGSGLFPAIGGGSTYTGPGDIVSGASSWYGLRGYSAAYATGSNPAIDVVDTATGLITTTVNILSDGTLDVATLLGLGYATSIKKLYDQTGNGNHATQATLSKMPALTLNALNTNRPTMTFVSANVQLLVSSAISTINSPFTVSAVVKRTGNTGVFSGIMTGNNDVGLIGSTSANTLAMYAGSVKTFTVTDNVYHAAQGIFNSTSGFGYFDQTVTSISTPGTNAWTAANYIGSRSGGLWEGAICEVGIWTTAFTGNTNGNSLNTGNMNTNQSGYWGVA